MNCLHQNLYDTLSNVISLEQSALFNTHAGTFCVDSNNIRRVEPSRPHQNSGKLLICRGNSHTMANNNVENLKRIAKYLKVTPGTIGINNEKVNKAWLIFVSDLQCLICLKLNLYQ